MEKYSTLDYLEIDKLKGKVNFFKLGASSSYLFNKNGKCKIIENTLRVFSFYLAIYFNCDIMLLE